MNRSLNRYGTGPLSALATTLLLGSGLGAQTGTLEGTVRYRGLAVPSAVVFLDRVGTGEAEAAAGQAATIDQVHLRFVPKVIAVSPGTTVHFLNSEQVLHNIFSPPWIGEEAFDLGTYPEGESRSHTFDSEGVQVILCNVHPEMVAYVVVVDSPFRDVTGEGGRFRIENVPTGTYLVKVWQRGDPFPEADDGRSVEISSGRVFQLTLDLGSGQRGLGLPRSPSLPGANP